jgi:putative Mg2+ transporter-C (MgtC) family protein
MELFDIDLRGAIDPIVSLLVSFVLALPVAWHREIGPRHMGLRTFPLVAVASCSYVLIGLGIAGDNSEAMSRIIQGLMTGIGFVGGGAIVKSKDNVEGASTAAAIWATGGVGAAVATNRLELAIAIAVLTFLTFLILTPISKEVDNVYD